MQDGAPDQTSYPCSRQEDRDRVETTASILFIGEVKLPQMLSQQGFLCLLVQNQVIRPPFTARESRNQGMGFSCQAHTSSDPSLGTEHFAAHTKPGRKGTEGSGF